MDAVHFPSRIPPTTLGFVAGALVAVGLALLALPTLIVNVTNIDTNLHTILATLGAALLVIAFLVVVGVVATLSYPTVRQFLHTSTPGFAAWLSLRKQELLQTWRRTLPHFRKAFVSTRLQLRRLRAFVIIGARQVWRQGMRLARGSRALPGGA